MTPQALTLTVAVMKTATVSEVGDNFQAILEWIEAGEEVEVAREGKIVAVISPVGRRVQQPDYLARLKRNFGDRILAPEASAEIRELSRGKC